MIKIPLKIQFSFFVAILISTAIILVSIIMYRHEKLSLFRERQLRGKTLVRNLATASADAILSDNELNLFSYCNDIIENEEDARYIIIMNSKGRILAHNKPEFVGKLCDDPLCNEVAQSDSMLILSTTYNNETLVDYSIPMVIMDKRIGSVRVLMSNESILRKMDELAREVLQISVLAIIISLVLTLLLVHLLVKPIGKLTEGALIIGTGDFLHRIRVKSKNEIGDLAQAFNSMGDSLQKRKTQIASLNETSRALSTTLEQNNLLKKSLQAIDEIVTPKQCLLCLFNKDGLQIRDCSGFQNKDSLIGKALILQDSLYKSITSDKKSQVYEQNQLGDLFTQVEGNQVAPTDKVLIAPLVYEEKSKGTFILLGNRERQGFTDSDQEFTEILASATTISLLNIELLEETAEKARMESELKTAETVQQTLFPKSPLQLEGIEVFGFIQSASETGGDWYGYHQDVDSEKVSIYMGDVTGHGVPAALVTATANSFVKTINTLQERFAALASQISSDDDFLPVPHDPSYLLSLLNNIIYKSTERQLVMTFFASTIDLKSRKIHYANAGHEMPVVVKTAQGNTPSSLSASGTRLGDKPDISFDQESSTIDSGDVIVYYTDGITECMNRSGEEYGGRRFIRKIKKNAQLPAEDLLNTLIDDVMRFSEGEPLHDDITLVVAKIL